MARIFNPISLGLLGWLLDDAKHQMNKIADKFATTTKTPIAAEMASDFIQKKYGDRYSAELETVKSSYSFGYGGESLFHSVDGYVLCIKKDDDYSFYDSYQYEEIKAAVGNDIESYFSDHSGKLINSAFAVCEQHYYSDDTNCYMFSSYFDGDIDKFINSNDLSIQGYVTLEGEKSHTPEYIDDMERVFEDYEVNFSQVSLHIKVKDKGITLPDLPNGNYSDFFSDDDEQNNSVYIRNEDIPAGGKFLESLVLGYSRPSEYYSAGQERKMYSLNFQPYDENTDISICQIDSQERNKPLSLSVFDLDGISVWKDDLKHQNPKSTETPLKLNGMALKINYSGRDYPVIKLNREFYNLSENSVPLLLEEYGGIFTGNTYYQTLGWVGDAQGETITNRDLSFGGWYYMNEDFFYIAYPYCDTNTVIAFAERK